MMKTVKLITKRTASTDVRRVEDDRARGIPFSDQKQYTNFDANRSKRCSCLNFPPFFYCVAPRFSGISGCEYSVSSTLPE